MSIWDEMFNFAHDISDYDFVERNLSDSVIANLKINTIVITDLNGKILFSKAIDLKNKVEIPVNSELLTYLTKITQNRETKEETIDDHFNGFICISEQPILISAQRIFTGEKTGKSPGIVFFTRNVDNLLINDLEKLTQSNILFMGNIPSNAHPNSFGYLQSESNNETVNGYFPLTDIFNRQGYYIKVSLPRNIIKQGQLQITAFIELVFLISVFFIMINILLFNRIFVVPFNKTISFLVGLSRDKGLENRLPIERNDEFGKIAVTLNNLLDHLNKSQEALVYAGQYDSLTGLYNRSYFENELKQLAKRNIQSLTILCCDVDGLKLVNDTLGHSVGDIMLIETGRVLKETFGNLGLVARTGGDEFTIILTDIDESRVTDLSHELKKSLENRQSTVSGLQIKLSIGWKFIKSNEISEEVINIAIKEADDAMYRQKLSSSQSNRNALVQAMMKMLEVRDYLTEGHSNRLQEYATHLGLARDLDENKITDLWLLGKFHDIGKVGIPDSILLKPGPLTPEERKEMNRHAEIGHRIAQSIPELLPIADLILKHHEWWNGNGYPLGLKGEEIPIEDRILAIVDAYDAMTSDRPYRKAMTKDAAILELTLNSGVQFDPKLVTDFITILKSELA
ncbi:diguanylate cyclase [Heliobacillus mobilis]|uniref:Diguanylate cyclase n=1 Tax=Heliobacterium mobile TaxID=28064 RepID=A0A6I3SPP2_HELMO|nr:HD domain-containing phosphohydrolase [Heliobacterium mobile]MTV51008.1 diguanylate cyclase [Heliobacterium mobile]